MRPLICIFILTLIACTTFAQNVKHTQVVLEVKNFSHQKHGQEINQALKVSFGESRIVAYCELNSWIVLDLDLNYYKTREQLFETLKPYGFEYFIKDGASATEVELACKESIKKY